MATNPNALSKSTIIQTVWKNIKDRLSDNVTTVTITGSNVITIQTTTNSFPDKNADEKSNYPIIVVNSPEMDWDRLTFNKQKVAGAFTVDVYTTQSEAADKFLDAIIDSIETYKDDLKTVGMYATQLESTDTDNLVSGRGAFGLHVRSCTFKFNYVFTENNPGS